MVTLGSRQPRSPGCDIHRVGGQASWRVQSVSCYNSFVDYHAQSHASIVPTTRTAPTTPASYVQTCIGHVDEPLSCESIHSSVAK